MKGMAERSETAGLDRVSNGPAHRDLPAFAVATRRCYTSPMTWHGIREHDSVVEQFRRALARGRLASTFLFVGPEGVGKRAFALKLAQAMLCERVPEEWLDPCEVCPACVQVMAGTHPDLELVAKPEGR